MIINPCFQWLTITLQACRRCTGNTVDTCGAAGSDGPGVSNTDYILYVSAVMNSICGTGGSGTVAFASHCQLESAFDRCVHVCACITLQDLYAFADL